MDKIPKRDLKILMGDLNAKVGSDNRDKELIMGRHGVGEQNENGELFSEFCMFNAPYIWNSLPSDIREAKSESQFKNDLKTHLFKSYLCI